MSSTPYIGVTRFSVLSPKGSGLRLSSSRSREEYAAELFDEERLASRMKIFGELATPIYQSFAARFNYVHLVQYSPELPEKWKQALFDLSERYPVIRPIEVEGQDVVDTVRAEVLRWPRDFRGTFVWLRVDDDDILAIDYLDALSQYVTAETVGMAVSFSALASGILVGNQISDIHHVRMPLSALGQAYICRANNALGIIESPPMLPHHETDRHLPVISSGSEPHAFWMRHVLQDTAVGSAKLGAKLANLQADLGRHPFYSDFALLEKFPTLEPHIFPDNSSFSEQCSLTPDEWCDMSGRFMNWPKNAVVRIDFSATFTGNPHHGATISLSFNDLDAVAGHFPRDGERGDYRRLYADKFGRGTIIVALPNPEDLTGLRFHLDRGHEPISSVSLSISLCGEF